MADIKTHLREISFALKLGLLKEGKEVKDDEILNNPQLFFKLSSSVIKNGISSASNLLVNMFDSEQINIIKNGFKLAEVIYFSNKFPISYNDSIIWTGSNTQKDDLIDVKIGKYDFSLKEDSFILENMGLYKLLNLLTDKSYVKGLHVFVEFAPNEYEEWFMYTWNKMIDYVSKHSYLYTSKDYISSIRLENNDLIFSYKKGKEIIEKYVKKTEIKSWNDYIKQTNSKIREKVFSKWISEIIKNDKTYRDLKSRCSNMAGKYITECIRNNLDKSNLSRLLQIYPKSYYYAKITKNHIFVYRIPSIKEFDFLIKINKVIYSVPESQLNIITEIQNNKTKKVLLFRNECRFSHGQFNGTPEAKLYYDKNSDLSSIYISVINRDI